ncbi:MAG: hypothetical protein JXA67_16525 [Micromonosporaceae bacterium]|nr:hypothetical protein [Micromonosporaceae bacterium]
MASIQHPKAPPPKTAMMPFVARRGRKVRRFHATSINHPFVRGLVATGWTVTESSQNGR